MSKAKTFKAGLTVAAALFILSACASSGEVNDLSKRVSSLEERANAAQARVGAAEAKAAQLEAAASQCTATCNDIATKAERMYQQSLRK